MPLMILKTQRLTLRPLRAADAPSLFAILGDPEAMKFWDRPAIARTATATEIVASQLSAMEDGHFLHWTVWRGDDAIGSVDLSALDFMHKRGEIGFLFRRDQWGQGYGREAMGALIHHAFHQLQLERLEAKVHAANMPAKKLLGLLGFMPEGRLSGYVRRDGIRHDVDIFGRLNLSHSQNGA